MGLCPPCKLDDHGGHRGRYEVEVRRKGQRMKTRSVECDCLCSRPEIPRDPQPLPPMPWSHRGRRRRR